MKTEPAILLGCNAIINQWLEGWLGTKIGKQRHYKDKRSSLDLCASSSAPAAEKLVNDLYHQIEANWPKQQCKGKINWDFRDVPTKKPDESRIEVLLERRIAEVNPEDLWHCQIPTASGVGSAHYRRGSIDLAKQVGSGQYEFIELKIQSNNALFAAMEIMLYGLLYIFSRKNMNALGYLTSLPLLGANTVHLRVLAPRKFYDDYRSGDGLQSLERVLNNGIATFAAEQMQPSPLRMSFQFTQFHETFRWEDESFRKRCLQDDKMIADALSEIEPLYPSSKK